MRCDFTPLAVRFIHDCPQLLQRKGRNIIQNSVFPDSVAAVGIHFDPVRAVHDLFPHRFAGLIRAIHHLHAVRHRHIRRIAQQRVGSGHVQRSRHHDHPRPRYNAVVDRLLHIYIRIAGALGRQIPYGREPVFECTPRIHGCQDCPVLGRLLQQLLIVIWRSNVSLQQHMRVGVNHSWNACLVRQIDHLSTTRWNLLSHRRNFFAANFDHRVPAGLL
jgi:hypothetical protein